MSVSEKNAPATAPLFTDPRLAAHAVAQALKAHGLKAEGLGDQTVWCGDPECKVPATSAPFTGRLDQTQSGFNGRKPSFWLVVSRVLNPENPEASGDEVLKSSLLCSMHSNQFRKDVALVGLSQADRKDEAKRQAAIEAAGIVCVSASSVITALEELELPAEEQAELQAERAAKAALQTLVDTVLESTTTCALTGAQMTYGDAYAVSDRVVDALLKATDVAFVDENLQRVAKALKEKVIGQPKDGRGYPRFVSSAAAAAINAALPKDRNGEPRPFYIVRDGNGKGWRLAKQGEDALRSSLLFEAGGLIYALERNKAERAGESQARDESFVKLGEIIPGLSEISLEEAQAAQPSHQPSRDRNDRGGNGNRGNYRGGKGGQRRGGGYTHPRRGEDGSRR